MLWYLGSKNIVCSQFFFCVYAKKILKRMHLRTHCLRRWSLFVVVLFGDFFKGRHCKIAWAFWDQIQQDNNFTKAWFPLESACRVGNAEEEKYYETFYTLTLGPIGIAKNVNRADFKLSILYIDFYGLLRFVREIESILLKYVNVMSRWENILFSQCCFQRMKRAQVFTNRFSKKFNYCICFGKFVSFMLNHLESAKLAEN